MNRSRIAVTLMFIAFASLGLSAYAEECQVSPTVSVTVSPQPTGIPVVTVSYGFPDTTSSSQRGVGLRIIDSSGGIGNIGGFRPADAAGTWTVNHDMSCKPTGTYTYEASAMTCNVLERKSTASYSHNVRPTVSVSYAGPDDQGHGDLIVGYDFPNTAHPSQRFLRHRIYHGAGFGTGGSLQPADRAGTWTFPYAMTCRTGTYEHEITAITCSGEEDVDRAAVAVSTKPSVAVSAGGLQENGDVALSVSYGFPNTDHSSQRSVVVRIEEAGGGFGTLAGLQPDQQYGVWNLTRNGACELRNLTAWVIATSCTGESAEARHALPKPEKPSVSVTLSKVKSQPGWLDATILYDMQKATALWSIRLDLSSWQDANGQTYAGYPLLWPETPANRAGTKTVRFRPPSGAQQLSVRATAATCAGRETADASIPCDRCDPPSAASANPVFFSTGNVLVTDTDPLPPIAGHRLVRTYNSDEQVVALFGRGSTTLFERRMILDNDGVEQIVSFVTDANQVVTFRGSGEIFRQTWPNGRQLADTLTYDAATATYVHRPARSTEVAVFRAADGRLSALRDLATGREAQVTYSAQGLPQSLTDSWSGTSWLLTIDAPNRRVSSIGVSGRPDLLWSYSYDGAGNLLTVTAPGNVPWRTYHYSANRMTASYDGAGHLIESHTYDADGYGISSTGPEDEIAAIAYDLPGSVPEERVTRVTYETGATAEYALRPIGGAYRAVRVTGGCASCGAGDATYAYDSAGRLIREQGADGFITVRTYATNHLASEQRHLRPAGCDPSTDAQHCRLGPDALANATLVTTPASLLTTFTHADPFWPDKVTAVETPSVLSTTGVHREELVYDGTSGALRKQRQIAFTGSPAVETSRTSVTSYYGDACDPASCPYDSLAPAFAPGGSFSSAWLSLPQPPMVKSVDGPREDVQDISAFVYYPVHASVPPSLRGHLAASRNAAGHVIRFETYDGFGNATRVVDPNGVATELTADLLGRVATSTLEGVPGCDTTADPLCATDLSSVSTYSPAAGPLQSSQSPSGSSTVFTYDSRGRVRTLSRGPSVSDLKEQIETSYDPLTGKKSLARTFARENGTWVEKLRESFAYDQDGRLKTITHGDGSAVHYAYDHADRVASVRDENHSAPNTFYQYDPAGRLSAVDQALSTAPGGKVTTRYGYDVQGNLTSVTDPNGNVTSYVYDDFGQMLSQNSPVSGTTTYAYDNAGNLVTMVDANGATTERSYDALNRMVSSTSSRPGAESEVVTYAYDVADGAAFSKGRLTMLSDPQSDELELSPDGGATTYTYDRRGLLITQVHSDDALAFGYDSDGNRTRIGYPSGRVVEYAFDFGGRPVSTSVSGVAIVGSVTYLPFGPLTTMAYGNGTQSTKTYDSRYRMAANRLSAPAGVIANYAYRYDAAGNITELHDLVNPAYDRDFGYDDLNRLVTANTGAALWGIGTYQYDAMGNMTLVQIGARSQAFSYVGLTPKVQAVTGTFAETATYDNVGNETFQGRARYGPQNRLRRVGDGDRWSTNADYGYDGRGARVATLITRGMTPPPWGRTSRRSVYSPEFQLLAQTDWSGNLTELGAFAGTEYIWFNGVPVAQTFTDPSLPIRYTFTDHLGTPILQTDPAGTVIWRAEYEPYGRVYAFRAGAEGDAQSLRFPGQETDELQGLIGADLSYNIFRWYRAGWGRYSQVDPIGLRAGMNLYGYVKGNPVAASDPLGLEVQYIGETNREIQVDCASATALGCTRLEANVRCGCAPGCDPRTGRSVWAANASVRFGPIRVYFSTDCYDTGRIIMEEERHVRVYQDSIREARERTADMDGRTFNNKGECDEACRDFIRDMGRIVNRPLVHVWIDFTHPTRRCDGSVPWI